jgi:putative Holliday junction resolvase
LTEPRVSPTGAILGIDLGERRIGVAVAVPDGRIALPLTVVEAGEGWLERLATLVGEHNASDVVIGLPLSLNGTEGMAARRARQAAAEVETHLGLPVHLVDERLSTVAAGRALAGAGATSRRQKVVVDRSAAAVILQAYLDSVKEPGTP